MIFDTHFKFSLFGLEMTERLEKILQCLSEHYQIDVWNCSTYF